MLSSNNAGLWFIIIIFMLLSAVLALFIGQSYIAQSEQKRLVSYAQEVLAQGVSVAQESHDTMQRILLGNVPCSDADLSELRLLSFYALNLRDVGRIENDRLICSAGWGRLNPPIPLFPPDLTTSTGTQLWTAMERLVDPRITADI
ncbi:MAG: CSS-motif domain-containing protein [Symbiopectobacterium sp.]